jgi:hypothetical protein
MGSRPLKSLVRVAKLIALGVVVELGLLCGILGGLSCFVNGLAFSFAANRWNRPGASWFRDTRISIDVSDGRISLLVNVGEDGFRPDLSWRWYDHFITIWGFGDGQGGPYLIEIAAWIPFVLLCVVPSFILIRRVRRTRRWAATGRCVQCGYNLTGNVSGICPECGAALKSESQSAPAANLKPQI